MRQSKIDVGDEIEVTKGIKGVVTRVYQIGVPKETFCGVLYPNGNFSSIRAANAHKTGIRYPDILKILETLNDGEKL